jgi:hypothetical protein
MGLFLMTQSRHSDFCSHYVQLRDFDMCIVKNEEAIRIEPQFAECYGNMANALKVHILNSYGTKDVVCRCCFVTCLLLLWPS